MMPALQETSMEPQSILAEQAVIGVLLSRSDLLNIVSPALKPEDFYAEPHKIIYTVMLNMSAAGELVDLVGVQDKLTQTKRLERAGGPAYLTGTGRVRPSGANIDRHVFDDPRGDRRVARSSRRRTTSRKWRPRALISGRARVSA